MPVPCSWRKEGVTVGYGVVFEVFLYDAVFVVFVYCAVFVVFVNLCKALKTALQLVLL
jgi:hypothetical protein